ncbi:hypothetical protein GCM10007874_50480 [Labrys miyagiensis]|uniref:Tail assembly chaperone n=1 Tax=Labrys miyagiensis TaxID=346912 RepID=A0ABQ6CNU9_9HYPH|nr:hypothetical protein [Labrys miyagiensis]GLS22031.1 hypothetical protein GCM10007874_50480 [Labrys miyagiensis]
MAVKKAIPERPEPIPESPSDIKPGETLAQYKARKGDLLNWHDIDELDKYNPGMGFEDIVRERLDQAGGDPLVALRLLVRRAMYKDDAIDCLMLELHKLDPDNSPMVEQYVAELQYRLEKSIERTKREFQFEPAPPGFWEDEAAWKNGPPDEPVGSRPPGWRDLMRRSQGKHFRVVK